MPSWFAAVILLSKRAIVGCTLENVPGNTEAVFSSSEDIVRASQAEIAVAGRSIVCGSSFPLDRSRNWLGTWTAKVTESLFSVLFPSDCRLCGTILTNVSRLPVCRQCLDDISPISGVVCAICGERLFSDYALADAEGPPRCGLCRRVPPIFARAAAYGSYESGLRELVHLLKFGGVRPAASVLGRMLAEATASLEAELSSDSVIVIPVPLHRTKLRQRGFNQAELIAREAVKFSALPERFRLCDGVLERRRETASQVGLTSHQRRSNLRGAFGVAQAGMVAGREVLVVDDVYTTGATVSECARVLLRAGATKVWVATVARTLKISAQHVEIRADYCPEEASGISDFGKELPLSQAAGG